jgi:hypothetical protein
MTERLPDWFYAEIPWVSDELRRTIELDACRRLYQIGLYLTRIAEPLRNDRPAQLYLDADRQGLLMDRVIGMSVAMFKKTAERIAAEAPDPAHDATRLDSCANLLAKVAWHVWEDMTNDVAVDSLDPTRLVFFVQSDVEARVLQALDLPKRKARVRSVRSASHAPRSTPTGLTADQRRILIASLVTEYTSKPGRTRKTLMHDLGISRTTFQKLLRGRDRVRRPVYARFRDLRRHTCATG